MTMANRASHARRLRGWSVGETASRIGCALGWVRRWDHGELGADESYRQAMLDAFAEERPDLSRWVEKGGPAPSA